MSGRGRIISVDRVSDQQRRPALRLWTDHPEPRCCVLIARQEPHPMVGDTIEWGPHHVKWDGRKLDKIGWEFDPNEPLQ